MTDFSKDRVFDLIAAYGAEPGGWPAEEREAAKAMIAADPEHFADALTGARAVDAALLSERVPEPSAELADRILAAAPRARREAGGAESWLSWLLPNRQWPAGATLASLMIGLVSGYAYAGNSSEVSVDSSDAVYVSLFGEAAEIDWLEEDGSE